MNLFLVVILLLFGVSLIGTVLQDRNSSLSNSQNILFGCVGGLISYFCGFPISIILIVTIICVIISYFIFKCFVSTDVFIIKSEKLLNIIIFLALNVVFLTIMYLVAFDMKMFFDPIFIILYLLIFISTEIRAVPKFINFIKKFNLNDLEDGEIIYIVDNFFEGTQNSIGIFGDKKFYYKSMRSIVGKRCVVEEIDGKYMINLEGRKYFIKEKNGKLLNSGDVVKISKDNLNQGMIRKNTSIIVEKENI